MSHIFISYRRDDSGGHSGRLHDHLTKRFGNELIFFDLNSIQPGEDFVSSIKAAVGSCKVFLAIIGRRWLNATDNSGQRRLDDPNDIVRLEIAAALQRSIKVIPVLVDGASMPHQQELPIDIQQLALRNAHEVSNKNFQRDVNDLIQFIEAEIGDRDTANWGSAIPMPKLRQPFTDEQRNDFLYQSFEIIKSYFQTALSQLEASNSSIETSLRAITETKFTCEIYVNGKSINRCKIWLGRGMVLDEAIGYIDGRFDTNSDTSWSEMISVRDDGSTLFLQPSLTISMTLRGYQPKQKPEPDDIAELLWRRFTERLDGG